MSTPDDQRSDSPTLDDLVPSESTKLGPRRRQVADEEAAGLVESELDVLLEEWDPLVAEQIAELIRQRPQRMGRLLSGKADLDAPDPPKEQRVPMGGRAREEREGGPDASSLDALDQAPQARHRLEGEGAPVRDDPAEPFEPAQVQRSRRRAGQDEHDDVDPPASPAEAAGSPSRDARQRVTLGEEEQPTWQGLSPVEGLGQPSPDAGQRLALGEEEQATWRGTSPVEPAGVPSADPGQRMALGEEEQPTWQGPSPLEAVGSPTDRVEERVHLGEEEQVSWVGASGLESVGSPSERRGERVHLGEGEDPPPLGPSTAEGAGNPTDRAIERMIFGLGAARERGDRRATSSAGRELLEYILERALLAGMDPEDLLLDLEAAGFPEGEARRSLRSAGMRVDFEASRRKGAAPFESIDAAERMRTTPVQRGGGGGAALGGAAELSTDAAERVRRPEPRPAGGPQGNGLDGALNVPILDSAPTRSRREEVEATESPLRPGLDPVPPTRVRVAGAMSREQQAAYGEDPRFRRSRVDLVLDFVHHRFELLEVERRLFNSWSDPAAPLQAEALPRFAAGELPFGNGLLAFLLESRYAHDLNADGQLRLLGTLWKTWTHKHLREATAHAHALVRPVVDQVWAELCTAKGVKVDAGSLSALHVSPERAEKGTIRAAATPELFRIWYQGPKTPDLLGELGSGAEDGLKEVAEIFARTMQWNREARWTNVRRRFIAALPASPERTGRVLLYLERIHRAEVRAPKERPALLKALKAHLEGLQETEGARVEDRTPLAHAVSYALQQWPSLADATAEVERKPLAWRAEAQPWILDDDEAPAEEHMAWVSLVHGVNRLGGRPWTYLRDLLDAACEDRPLVARDWTPAAWWSRRRR